MKNPLIEFRNKDIVEKEIKNIFFLAEKIKKNIHIMEVCGTHTMQISKFGIRKLMPENVKLLSGPGCPVCVTPQKYIDTALYIVRNYENLIICTFGDIFRVPGSDGGSLEKEKSIGKEIKVIYTPQEVIEIAQNNKGKNVVFLSIGFETTMPVVACVVKEIMQKKIKNIYFLLGNKFFLPALEVVILISRNFLSSSVSEVKSCIDGFILPGHLSSITGVKSYQWIAKKYQIPAVITGFEPLDIVRGIRMILDMIKDNYAEIKNEYTRVVSFEGNFYAQQLINEVFEPITDEWRGIGIIPGSGTNFKHEFQNIDFRWRYSLPEIKSNNNFTKCKCNDVLTGKILPNNCPLFATICTPQTPQGACMVSSEGACAAYYKYERF
ncbi:MAG: hydrogenase formation protein HypD [Endomicrobia bacterium]|nr:hydrogenase formation protein HypD [Endomicrobiia bacterium]